MGWGHAAGLRAHSLSLPWATNAAVLGLGVSSTPQWFCPAQLPLGSGEAPGLVVGAELPSLCHHTNAPHRSSSLFPSPSMCEEEEEVPHPQLAPGALGMLFILVPSRSPHS